MKNMRYPFVLLCLMSLFAVPVFAAGPDVDGTQTDEEAKQNLENFKNASKKALENVGSALNDAGEAIGKKAKTISSKACVGTWVFTNGKAVTTLICNDDGTIEIREKGGIASRYWKGTYTATGSMIDFHVMFEGTKYWPKTMDGPVEKKWIIHYKVSDNREMRFVSSDVPDDRNGYDFSNAALFKKR